MGLERVHAGRHDDRGRGEQVAVSEGDFGPVVVVGHAYGLPGAEVAAAAGGEAADVSG
ncbi:hypothetical protein ACFYZ9_19840 [Streptomyces sp. NPDC001691]|uniref:hypothetical protein n=1 Tax=Streptomyces sp. NPDC001691 TaxID=3364600 RepID=UPI00369C07FF